MQHDNTLVPVDANPSASNLDCLKVNLTLGCIMLWIYGLLNLTLQQLTLHGHGTYRMVESTIA